MADVKICDRCGKTYSNHLSYKLLFGDLVDKKIKVSRKGGIIHFFCRGFGCFSKEIEFDLCDDCMDELESWLRGESEDKQ